MSNWQKSISRFAYILLATCLLHLSPNNIRAEVRAAAPTESPSETGSVIEKPPILPEESEVNYEDDINSKKRKSEIFDMVLEGDYDTKIRPPG